MSNMLTRDDVFNSIIIPSENYVARLLQEAFGCLIISNDEDIMIRDRIMKGINSHLEKYVDQEEHYFLEEKINIFNNYAYIINLYLSKYSNIEALNLLKDETFPIVVEAVKNYENLINESESKLKKIISKCTSKYESEYVKGLKALPADFRKYNLQKSEKIEEISIDTYMGTKSIEYSPMILNVERIGFQTFVSACNNIFCEHEILDLFDINVVNDMEKLNNNFESITAVVVRQFAFSSLYSEDPIGLRISEFEAKLILTEIIGNSLTSKELINQVVKSSEFKNISDETKKFILSYKESLNYKLELIKQKNTTKIFFIY